MHRSAQEKIDFFDVALLVFHRKYLQSFHLGKLLFEDFRELIGIGNKKAGVTFFEAFGIARPDLELAFYMIGVGHKRVRVFR